MVCHGAREIEHYDRFTIVRMSDVSNFASSRDKCAVIDLKHTTQVALTTSSRAVVDPVDFSVVRG